MKLKVFKKSFALTIGIPLKGLSVSKSSLPEMMQEASATRANSRNLLSLAIVIFFPFKITKTSLLNE